MSETTNIAWADHTRNFWTGCTKVGPGCDGCYAEAFNRWTRGKNEATGAARNWGAGSPRIQHLEGAGSDLRRWNARAVKDGVRRRVFINSMADFFDNEIPAAWRTFAWNSIIECRALDFLILTKRIGNAASMLPRDWGNGWPHVWLGATVVNQEEADRDIPKLLQVPAAVRFLSIEPMLGPIDLTTYQPFRWQAYKSIKRARGLLGGQVDWVIVGGESDQPGHRARPFNIEWARDIVRQCKAAGVPVFVKQMGSFVIDRNDAGFDGCEASAWPDGTDDKVEHDIYGVREEYQGADVRVHLVDRAGADPMEWPQDLRIRGFPR